MPILGLHPTSDYAQERYNFLDEVEGNEPRVYVVKSEYIATIGIGINLNASTANLNAVLIQLGFDINGTQLTGDAWIAEQYYIGEIRKAVKVTYYTNDAVQKALDGILQNRAADSRYSSYPSFTRRSVFQFDNDTESKNAFDAIIGTYESRVDSRLGYHLKDSKERIALVSLAYNSKTGETDLLGDKLMAAINNDNRAEAWYEIRYNSNLNKIHANRRYKEANLFGLYDTDPSNVTEAEAKEIMRMYTRYEYLGGKLSAYEGGYKDKPLKSIDAEVQDASDYLAKKFAIGNTINGKVIVGAGLDSYAYLGENINDNLTGTKDKNDLIFGEKGNDTLDGGGDATTDVMIGGADDDTYIVDNTGDVVTEAANEGTDTVKSSATFTLRDNVENLTLMGEENIDGTGNELPNVITGNTGDNKLDGGGGDDTLTGGGGNNDLSGGACNDILDGYNDVVDFLYGEAGNDTLYGGSGDNNRLYGGANDDILYGANGNDFLYGEAGNDLIYGGGGNDNIEGGAGNDTIYGEADSDEIDGGSGNDVLYSGGGENDTFVDSSGFDTYYIKAQSATITDTGGDGCVFTGGRQLKGGKETDTPGKYYDKESGDYYFWQGPGSTLRIQCVTGSVIYVNNFSNDNLQIHLEEEEKDESLRTAFYKGEGALSPIILDLDRDGIETTNINTGTFFDHDGNGFAELTGWVSADDGLLVMDRDRNGTINSSQAHFFVDKSFLSPVSSVLQP